MDVMKGFRPSKYGDVGESEDTQHAKEKLMRVYAERARARLPLFNEPEERNQNGTNQQVG